MKSNDFEFIKDKFSQSGVNAPESLNAEMIKDRLNGIEPLSSVQGGKNKSNKMILVAGIALFTTVALSSAIFFSFAPVSKIKSTIFPNKYGVTAFSSHKEINQELEQLNMIKEKYNSFRYYDDVLEYGAAAPDSASGSTGSGAANGGTSGSSSESFNSTYTQVEGVDEADIVKTDGKYIYSVSSDKINIYPADPENMDRVAVLNNYDYNIIEFFINGNLLITVSNDFSKYTYDLAETMTYIFVYDISDIDNIFLTGKFCQSGDYTSSRLIDNTLYLVSSAYAYNNDFLPRCGGSESTSDQVISDFIPANDVYMVQNPSEPSFTVVSSIDIVNPTQPLATKAILGSADEIYCNTEHLYLTAQTFEKNAIGSFIEDISYELDLEPYYYIPENYKTQVIKIDLNSDIDFIGSTTVGGYIDNQYALDEFEGNLRIATTSQNSEGEDINNLFVINAEMKEIGSVTGFANNESIKAVRYIGNTAYVITYERTDPLFVIDLSTPTAPKITGEVKISGFSTMLVPVDENTLLGIGYHTQPLDDESIDMEYQSGLKLVVFDISDKKKPVVSDTKVFEGVYSDVQSDPKALLYNSERNDYTIPYYSVFFADNLERTMIDKRYDTGIINFKVADGKISVTDKYSSEVFSDTKQMKAVNRCVYVGANIYMINCDNYIEYYFDDYENNEAGEIPKIDCVKYKD